MLKLTILGCGTSSGVPRIGNDWGSCDPLEPRNRRRRAAILVESETTRILVDTGPDMREQLLDAGVPTLDAVLWTHDHADHSHGIDDLRQVMHNLRRPVDGYAIAPVMQCLTSRFGYAFAGSDTYGQIITPHILAEGPTVIGDISVRWVVQPHGPIFSTGFHFQHHGRTIGYATDYHAVTDDMVSLFTGVDVWVIDALRVRPHPTHASLSIALDAIVQCQPTQAILTHMDWSMDYRTLVDILPAGVEPGYDGMTVTLGDI